MPNNVGRLGVVLGLNSAEFVVGIENASKKLEAFADKTAYYARTAAIAFAGSSVAALTYAKDIYDVAKANEMAVDSIVKLKLGLSQAGGSIGDASK